MLIDYTKELQHLDKIRKGEIRQGYTLGIPEIDNFYRMKPASFDIFLGQANVGKTTMVLYMMLLYSLRHDIKWIVFSSENEPSDIIKKLIEFLSASPINLLSDEDYKYAVEVIKNYFKFISPDKLYTYRDILGLAQSYKNAWDYQGLLIDPYNSLIKDPELSKHIDGHSYDYQAMTEIRHFAKETGVSVWMNIHAVTGAIRMTHPMGHQYAGFPIVPSAGDGEGGSKNINRSDQFVCIHRYLQHPTDWNQTHIHIRKVKSIESGGKPTSLDNPIILKSIKNNVGFEIDGVNIVKKIIEDKKAKTFLRKA